LCLDVEIESEYQFERRMFGSNPEQLRSLAGWLLEQEAEEVVMESTAQYWKPVWGALERYWKPLRERREGARRRSGTLHLAQAQSNRGRRGRKRISQMPKRLVKRLVARELILELCARCRATFVADSYAQEVSVEVRSGAAAEPSGVLLEEAHIKLSSWSPHLLGLSARRMLKALADGETNPATLAALADQRLRATPEQLCDALGACTELNVVYRQLLRMALEELRLIDEQIGQLDQEMASLLSQHQDAVERLAEVPGLGVDSAQQIIAEVGPTAATFPSEKCLSSWVGACPGDDESAGINYKPPLSKGQPPHAAVTQSDCERRSQNQRKHLRDYLSPLSPASGTQSAIGAIAHRQCRLIWLILHQGSSLRRTGPRRHQAVKAKAHEENDPQLRNLGYRIEPPNHQPSQAQAQ